MCLWKLSSCWIICIFWMKSRNIRISKNWYDSPYNNSMKRCFFKDFNESIEKEKSSFETSTCENLSQFEKKLKSRMKANIPTNMTVTMDLVNTWCLETTSRSLSICERQFLYLWFKETVENTKLNPEEDSWVIFLLLLTIILNWFLWYISFFWATPDLIFHHSVFQDFFLFFVCHRNLANSAIINL